MPERKAVIVSKATSDKDRRRLEELLVLLEPTLRRKFLEFVNATLDSLEVDELVDMIERGRIEEVALIVERAAAKFAKGVTDAYLASGESTGGFLGNALEVIVDFDTLNFGAIDAARAMQYDLVREITRQQMEAVREVIVDGVKRGTNPRQQAIALRESIGLTGRQQDAVNNYRGLLEARSSEVFSRALRDRRFDSTVRDAIRADKPLSQAAIDRMVSRYAERMLKFRTETIARTEALRAVHEGAQEMYRQAFAAGDLAKTDVVRIWNNAGDDRVRDSHETMDLQERMVDEPFVSGAGRLIMFPGDPAADPAETIQCRCVVSVRLKASALGLSVEPADAFAA